jgi:hypothetical protein
VWPRNTAGRRGISVQNKLKCGAAGSVRSNPQAAIVGLDNRTANRQAHPHTARFCREERLEYALAISQADSCSRVSNRYHYANVVLNFGCDAQNPRLIHGRHRIDGVCDQVQKHLLQLNSISYYVRQLFVRLGLDEYPMILKIAA